MIDKIVIFLTGCIGAAAPEIVRLYKIRSRRLRFKRFYFFISVIFFFLGGFVAVILPATTLWGAFYVGASLPIIISSFAGKSPSHLQRGGFTFPAESVLVAFSPREYLGCLLL